MRKKTYSCEDLQGSVYFAPNVLRHCCQRFFVKGKMQGDVEIMKIKSDYGEYNNITLDINFKSNIVAEYEESTLKAQYAEYSNSQGFLAVSDNVIVNDIQGNLVADKLLFDIKSQTLKIETFNDERISVNVDTDEKRF